MDSRQLAIPIYLNQRVVFDLLAIVEGGLSQIQSVRSSGSSTQSNKSETLGQIGISNVFAFLSFGVGGSRSRDRVEQSAQDISEDRVFTPASLFSRMRDALIERDLLHSIESIDPANLSAGTFVEFSAILRKNPLVEALETFIKLTELSSKLTGSASIPSNPRRSNSNKSATHAGPVSVNPVDMFKGLLADITESQTVDLVASLRSATSVAIVPVELDYFSDRTPAAIIDGQFVVLGKVVRTIPEEEGSIDLLRGTSLCSISGEIIENLIEAFATAGAKGINFPEIVTKVQGPAIQVIPIGIYA
jgi:hypothetical protein